MKARLVYNPSAGARAAHDLIPRACDELRARDWDLEICETARIGDAVRLARQAADSGFDMVIAVGGDGTLNEAANGVVGSQTALGVLPLGTANVWAREMGLPMGDALAGARLLAQAQVREIDVGCVSGPTLAPRIFILWCGVGLDAVVTRSIEPQRDLKRRLGALVFWLVGIREAWSFRGQRVTLDWGDRITHKRVILALAANAQLYGGIVKIAPTARVDDGLLNLVLFKGTGFSATAWHLIRVFLGLHVRDPQVEIHPFACVKMGGKNLAVQVDGEPIGFGPVELSIRPRSLRVLVPPTANMGLFAGH